MAATTRRPLLRLSPHQRIVVSGVLVLYATVFVIELGSAAFFAFGPLRFESIRLSLLGSPEAAPLAFRLTGQPYLTIVPAPNVADKYGPQHNKDGYRGKLYPMPRRPRTARIVCLGGSTTYDWTVERADRTYPARLEAALDAQRPPGVDDVEVINAGTISATTAELLTYYHFKFRYYHPELVIIDAGGNDAATEDTEYYQPDYSHWRRTLLEARPLPAHSRWMLHSKALSLMVILFFRAEYLGDQSMQWPNGHQSPAVWYPDTDRRGQPAPLPDADIAFRHNLAALCQEVRRDGVGVLLVPFRLQPVTARTDKVKALIARNEQLLKDYAAAQGWPVAPFPHTVISPENWTDDCHVNAAGAQQKADHIAPYAAAALWDAIAGGQP